MEKIQLNENMVKQKNWLNENSVEQKMVKWKNG